MLKRAIYSFCFIFLSIYAFAQSIKAKVLLNDGSPIAAAFIRYSNVTAVTNTNGEFSIVNAKVGDTIFVEAMGFDHRSYILSKKDFQNKCSIVLNTVIFTLPDIMVKSVSAKDLLFQALKISKGMLPVGVLYKAYYREYMQFESKIKKYTDGILDISVEKEKVPLSVVSTRVIDALSEEDGAFDKKYRSMFKIRWLVEDFFPENISDAFKEKEGQDYIYKYKGKTDSFFVINVCPNKKLSADIYKQMDVYINSTDTTISSVAFTLIPSKRGTVVKKNLVSSMSPIDLMYVMRYENGNGFTKLKYVKMMTHSDISLLGKRHDVSTVSELFVDHRMPPLTHLTNVYGNEYLYQNGNQYTEPFWLKMEDRIENTEEVITFLKEHQ